MNLALIGYGKMGKEIEKIAEERLFSIKLIIDENCSGLLKEKDKFECIDVILDFSAPDAFRNNYKDLLGLGKNIVVGTTGWYDLTEEIKDLVEGAGIGFIYGSNFSVGINVMFQLANYMGTIFNNLKDYDIFIEEIHHKFKQDAPSGTAIKIEEEVKKGYKRMCFSQSVRGGYINGIHRVICDSTFDTLILEHCAKSREGFARGALMAADWLRGRKGFYDFKDIFKELSGIID